MKHNFYIIIICMWTISISSCKSDTACDNSTLLTSDLFQKLIKEDGFKEEMFMDTEIHGFTFVLEKEKTLCAIGYQGQENMEDYLMELRNNRGEILFSEIMSFQNKKKEYKKVGNIVLNANDTFVITRKINGKPKSLTDLIGPVIRKNNSTNKIAFPVSNGVIKIIDVNYNSDSKSSIPFIDLEVKN